MKSAQAVTLEELSVILVPQLADQVAWNPDGVHLAVSTPRGGDIFYYDTWAGSLVWHIRKFGSGANSRFDRTGRYLVSSPVLVDPIDETEALSLFDAVTGQVVRHITASPPDEQAVTNFPEALALSPAGDKGCGYSWDAIWSGGDLRHSRLAARDIH